MKKLILILNLLGLIILTTAYHSAAQQEKSSPGKDFTFVFITDIHIQSELNAVDGFRKAMDMINELHPDFVITGGDLVLDALEQTYSRADSLYNLYTTEIKRLKMPVYNTIGNHEHYGWYIKTLDTLNPEYGDKMFEKRIGKRFFSFDHNGWHFIILDSVEKDGKGGYQGGIDASEIAWLKEDLVGIDPATPVVVSVHIPFITVEGQLLYGSTHANNPGAVITNSSEVLDLFRHNSLKLVLQGHLHYFEDIYAFGTRYITGGSVAGAWWEGPNLGTEEGFVLIKVHDDSFDAEYVDYGWEAKKN